MLISNVRLTGFVPSPAPPNVISVTFLMMTYALYSDSLKGAHGVVDSTSTTMRM